MHSLREHMTLVNMFAALVHLGLLVGGCVLLVALADALWGATHITYTRVVDWSAIAAGGLAAACVAITFLAWRHGKSDKLAGFEPEHPNQSSVAPLNTVEGGAADPSLDESTLMPQNKMSWRRAALALLYSVFTKHSQSRLRVITLLALGAVVLASLAKQDAEVAQVAAAAIISAPGDDDGDDDGPSAVTAEVLALQASAMRRAQVQVASALVLLAIAGLVLVGALVRVVINVTALVVMHLSGWVCKRAQAAVLRLPKFLGNTSARMLFRACVCALVITVLVLVQLASWGSLTVYNNSEAVAVVAFLTAFAWGAVLLGCAVSSAAGANRTPIHGLAAAVGLPEATALALLLTAVAIQVSLMHASEARNGSMRLTVITALAVAVTLHLAVVVLLGAEGMLADVLRRLVPHLRKMRKAAGAQPAALEDPVEAAVAANAGVKALQAATFMAVTALGILCVVLGFMGAPGIINIHNVHAASGMLFTALLAVAVFALVANMVLLTRVSGEKLVHIHEKLQYSTMVLVFAVVAAWPILWTTDSVTGTVSGLTLLLLAGAQTLGTMPWNTKAKPVAA